MRVTILLYIVLRGYSSFFQCSIAFYIEQAADPVRMRGRELQRRKPTHGMPDEVKVADVDISQYLLRTFDQEIDIDLERSLHHVCPRARRRR